MPKHPAPPETDERPATPEPDERKDRIKVAIFFFGTIALMFVVKLILGI